MNLSIEVRNADGKRRRVRDLFGNLTAELLERHLQTIPL